MAILGSVGKIFGLPSAQETVTAITGSPQLGSAAGIVSTGLSNISSSVLGQEQGQSTAVDIAPGMASETQGSGSLGGGGGVGVNYGYTGAVAPFLPGLGTQILRNLPKVAKDFATGVGVGYGAGEVADVLTGMPSNGAGMAPIVNGKKLRVTRKLKTQVRQAVALVGIDGAAQAMGVSPDIVLYIMTKKMRNDGAYVTKAAVRKTRSTIKKMKNMCDMYDDLRPAAKRAAPRRRTSSTTLIKN